MVSKNDFFMNVFVKYILKTNLKPYYKARIISLNRDTDPGRSVEWGLGSQFCQPILLQTKCIGFDNGITLHVGEILFILYENSD